MDINEIQRRVRANQYVYSHHAEIERRADEMKAVLCNFCMVYYDVVVLKEIERRFMAIEHQDELPDRYISIPEKAYA